jgi:hypothetical protein
MLAAILLPLPATSGAQDGNTMRQVVNGIDVYLGIVPAEIVRGHPSGQPEREMHGGAAKGGYHVMAALFEHASGKRITDAQVTAQLASPTNPGPETRLEPMTIAGALTYGNYIDMARGGSYRIVVQIHRPGLPDTIRATFTWRAE